MALANTTPTANQIPVADGTGKIAAGWIPSGAGAITPTGTGLRKVVAGVEPAAVSLLVNADVDAAAAIALSKLVMGAYAQAFNAAPTLLDAIRALELDIPDLILIKCDFSAGSTGDFGSRVSGTAAAITYAVTDTAHPGIATLATGTSGTGYAAVGAPPAGTQVTGFIVGTGMMIARDIFRIPTALSDGTNTYFVRSGFIKNLVIEPTDAIMFRYTDANSTGHLETVTRVGDVETVTNTGILISITDWYHCYSITNALGTSVGFYVGVNGATPTLVATHTTNIPVGVNIGPCTAITQTAGGTSRKVDLDFKSAIAIQTTAR